MKTFLIDVLERAAWTYVEALIALLAVSGPLDLDKVEVALVSALPAALAVVKGAVAGRVGTRGTAALVPSVLNGLPVVGGK